MEVIKIKSEDFFGKKLTSLKIIENTSYENAGWLLADKMLFCFDNLLLTLKPLTETDEISIEYTDLTKSIDGANYKDVFSEFIGHKFGNTWECTNLNGYFDAYLIGFDTLHPHLLVLSEGNTLKIKKIR
ncbi:DUF6334 family protein [Chitinophagaceae bacterium MMS25-I14]